MATFNGAASHIGAPGPWAQRRISFHATSTYSSAPAMEPLNQPIANGGGAEYGLGSHNHQNFHNSHHNVNGGGNGVIHKPGQSEPPSLPSNMPLHWIAPQKIGAGLSNLGNTCFLNSVLQCLTYTPPLAGYLQSGQHKATCRVAGFCAFCALQEHVQQALASSGKVVSPQKLAKNLRSICRTFRMGRQEDSHEYMRCLLDAMHKCCLPPDLAKNSNSKPSQEKSLVYRIFGGQLRSQVKCTVCSHCSNTYDPFLDLSLEINRADSLTKALSRFTAVDVLDGDNKYKCLRCKKKVRALKNFTIDLLPNILTIQFKRFSSTGGQGGKIDKKVEFGTTLDLKPFVSNPQDYVPKYKLFGVLVHSGWSTHSGHYYSFLRASSDIWHVFDDTRVRQVSEKTVLEQKAYMLFYVRDGKRVVSSQPTPVKLASVPATQALSTGMQALPRQLALTSKERQINSNPALSVRQIVSQPSTAPSKDNDRIPLTEVCAKKEVSASPVFPSKDRDGNELAKVLLKQAPVQAVSVSVERTLQPVIQSTGSVGNEPRAGFSSSGGPHVTVSASPVANASSPDEAASSPYDVPTKESALEKEMQSDSSCTTSGNSGVEEEWDDYYKKDRNPSGNTPQKFLKMLRVIPHTRRYYQARAIPAKRPSKNSNNGNGELENGHAESALEVLTPSSGGKRPQSVLEDARGSKRQHKDSGRSSMSTTCMASEEFSANEEPHVVARNGSGSKETNLQRRDRSEIAEKESSQDNSAANRVGDGHRVAKRPFAGTLEKGQLGSNGLAEISKHYSKESPGPRDAQHSEAESRVDRDAHSSRASDSGDCGPSRTSASGHNIEQDAKALNETVIPRARNALYGTPVPRWGDVNGDRQSGKEIDRLLEPEHIGSLERDIWDVEYDRGRSKKVKNKSVKEQFSNMDSNGVADSAEKRSNPFQSLGFAKKMGNGVKKGNGNSIGFKAGYGYGLKTGKNAG